MPPFDRIRLTNLWIVIVSSGYWTRWRSTNSRTVGAAGRENLVITSPVMCFHCEEMYTRGCRIVGAGGKGKVSSDATVDWGATPEDAVRFREATDRIWSLMLRLDGAECAHNMECADPHCSGPSYAWATDPARHPDELAMALTVTLERLADRFHRAQDHARRDCSGDGNVGERQ